MFVPKATIDRVVESLLQSDKATTAATTRDALTWDQSSIFMSLGLKNKALMKQGMDLYAKTMSGFQVNMVRLVSAVQSGEYDMATAVKRFRSIISDSYINLFKAGAMSVGNPYYADAAIGLSKRDLAFINKARRYETSFFKKFMIDVQNPNHSPVHPYLKRATYYADSGRAQFFNGMVMGSGDNVEIHWVLGVVEEHCGDCPILASKTYTWKTLPTTPCAGGTECLFNCKCHLEFTARKGTAASSLGMPSTTPGSATPEALSAPGRWASVVNSAGQEMTGNLVSEMDDLFAKVNKARQMIHISTDPVVKREWIDLRRDLNDAIIQRVKSGAYEAKPTTSVSALLDVIDSAQLKVSQVIPYKNLYVGQEVLMVRGDFFTEGIVVIRGTQAYVKTSKGLSYQVNDATDIILGGNGAKEESALSAKTGKYMEIEQIPERYANEETMGKWLASYDQTKTLVAHELFIYTNDELNSVYAYQEHAYSSINRYLRKKDTLLTSYDKKNMSLLDSALDKGKLKQDTVLYRCADPPKNIEKFHVGTTFVDRGFISSSVQKSAAENFYRTDKWRIKILAPEGTPALSVPELVVGEVRAGLTKREQEIILHRGLTYRVVEINVSEESMTIEVVSP
jgi:hypothetical protein